MSNKKHMIHILPTPKTNQYPNSANIYIYIYIVGKTQFVSHTKHTQQKVNRSTSFAIDNMYYVNFRI